MSIRRLALYWAISPQLGINFALYEQYEPTNKFSDVSSESPAPFKFPTGYKAGIPVGCIPIDTKEHGEPFYKAPNGQLWYKSPDDKPIYK